VAVTFADFRATLRLTWADPEWLGEKVFSYWNNQDVTSFTCDSSEVMHIIRASDGTFRLEIANLLHIGSLEELEELLYMWAREEGWLDKIFSIPPSLHS